MGTSSKDPIGFSAGDANLYRYVGNGPVHSVDPSGLQGHPSQKKRPRPQAGTNWSREVGGAFFGDIYDRGARVVSGLSQPFRNIVDAGGGMYETGYTIGGVWGERLFGQRAPAFRYQSIGEMGQAAESGATHGELASAVGSGLKATVVDVGGIVPAYQYATGQIGAEEYGDRQVNGSMTLLGFKGSFARTRVGQMTVSQASGAAAQQAQRAVQQLKKIELNPSALSTAASGVPLNLVRLKSAASQTMDGVAPAEYFSEILVGNFDDAASFTYSTFDDLAGARIARNRVTGAANEAHNAVSFARYKAELARLEAAQANSGTVIVRRPVAGVTAAQEAQIREYVSIANLAEAERYMSATGRVSTQGQLRAAASRAAAQERARAAAAGTPYHGVVGHGPDTTWTGRPDAPYWIDMDRSINSSIGQQALDYPLGYRPRRFIFEGDL